MEMLLIILFFPLPCSLPLSVECTAPLWEPQDLQIHSKQKKSKSSNSLSRNIILFTTSLRIYSAPLFLYLNEPNFSLSFELTSFATCIPTTRSTIHTTAMTTNRRKQNNRKLIPSLRLKSVMQQFLLLLGFS